MLKKKPTKKPTKQKRPVKRLPQLFTLQADDRIQFDPRKLELVQNDFSVESNVILELRKKPRSKPTVVSAPTSGTTETGKPICPES